MQLTLVEMLKEIPRDGPEAQVRQNLCHAYAELAGRPEDVRECAAQLVRFAVDDPDVEVRTCATGLLAELPPEAMRQALDELRRYFAARSERWDDAAAWAYAIFETLRRRYQGRTSEAAKESRDGAHGGLAEAPMPWHPVRGSLLQRAAQAMRALFARQRLSRRYLNQLVGSRPLMFGIPELSTAAAATTIALFVAIVVTGAVPGPGTVSTLAVALFVALLLGWAIARWGRPILAMVDRPIGVSSNSLLLTMVTLIGSLLAWLVCILLFKGAGDFNYLVHGVTAAAVLTITLAATRPLAFWMTAAGGLSRTRKRDIACIGSIGLLCFTLLILLSEELGFLSDRAAAQTWLLFLSTAGTLGIALVLAEELPPAGPLRAIQGSVHGSRPVAAALPSRELQRNHIRWGWHEPSWRGLAVGVAYLVAALPVLVFCVVVLGGLNVIGGSELSLRLERVALPTEQFGVPLGAPVLFTIKNGSQSILGTPQEVSRDGETDATSADHTPFMLALGEQTSDRVLTVYDQYGQEIDSGVTTQLYGAADQRSKWFRAERGRTYQFIVSGTSAPRFPAVPDKPVRVSANPALVEALRRALGQSSGQARLAPLQQPIAFQLDHRQHITIGTPDDPGFGDFVLTLFNQNGDLIERPDGGSLIADDPPMFEELDLPSGVYFALLDQYDQYREWRFERSQTNLQEIVGDRGAQGADACGSELCVNLFAAGDFSAEERMPLTTSFPAKLFRDLRGGNTASILVPLQDPIRFTLDEPAVAQLELQQYTESLTWRILPDSGSVSSVNLAAYRTSPSTISPLQELTTLKGPSAGQQLPAGDYRLEVDHVGVLSSRCNPSESWTWCSPDEVLKVLNKPDSGSPPGQRPSIVEVRVSAGYGPVSEPMVGGIDLTKLRPRDQRGQTKPLSHYRTRVEVGEFRTISLDAPGLFVANVDGSETGADLTLNVYDALGQLVAEADDPEFLVKEFPAGRYQLLVLRYGDTAPDPDRTSAQEVAPEEVLGLLRQDLVKSTFTSWLDSTEDTGEFELFIFAPTLER